MDLSRLPDLLADLVAPPACATCGAGCDSTVVLCRGCERLLARGTGIELSIPGIQRTWAARPYDGITRELVGAIKFRRLVPAVRRAAELIGEEAPPGLFDGGILLPVPADPIREAWRGFDPAYVLTRMLIHHAPTGMTSCLDRRCGRRQVGRTRAERLGSPPKVRTLGPRPPDRVVLVDDVTTTGATLAACAAALRSAGCAEVRAVVLAAAPA